MVDNRQTVHFCKLLCGKHCAQLTNLGNNFSIRRSFKEQPSSLSTVKLSSLCRFIAHKWSSIVPRAALRLCRALFGSINSYGAADNANYEALMRQICMN